MFWPASITISSAATASCSACCPAAEASRLRHHLFLPAVPGAGKPVPLAFLDFARFFRVHVGDRRSHAHGLGLKRCIERKKDRAAHYARERRSGDDGAVAAHQGGGMIAKSIGEVMAE